MYVISNNTAKPQFSIKQEFMLSVEKKILFKGKITLLYLYSEKGIYIKGMRYIMRLIIMYNIMYLYMTFPTQIPIRALYEITAKAKNAL